jgi:hypothetical protein
MRWWLWPRHSIASVEFFGVSREGVRRIKNKQYGEVNLTADTKGVNSQERLWPTLGFLFPLSGSLGLRKGGY